MIKAIVFDLGGVVFNTNFEKFNLFQKFIPLWNKAKVSEISSDDFFDEVAKITKTKSDKLKEQIAQQIKLDTKVKDLIIALNQNYKIGILTNTIEDLYELEKDMWNFEKVAEVIASFKEHVAKPDPEAIDLMLKKLNVDREEIIYIDDHPDTIEKYTAAGILCVQFKNYKDLLSKLNKAGIEI